MELILEPELKQWLLRTGRTRLTIDVIVSRGGCCGGCAYTETVINRGPPKEKQESYLLFQEDGLQVYAAGLLKKKTDRLTLYLKGSLVKRPALKGYDPDCSWK